MPSGRRRTVLATPVAPHGIERRIAPYADDFVALDTPRWFSAVGQFYDDFDQTTDAEVMLPVSPAARNLGRCWLLELASKLRLYRSTSLA